MDCETADADMQASLQISNTSVVVAHCDLHLDVHLYQPTDGNELCGLDNEADQVLVCPPWIEQLYASESSEGQSTESDHGVIAQWDSSASEAGRLVTGGIPTPPLPKVTQQVSLKRTEVSIDESESDQEPAKRTRLPIPFHRAQPLDACVPAATVSAGTSLAVIKQELYNEQSLLKQVPAIAFNLACS